MLQIGGFVFLGPVPELRAHMVMLVWATPALKGRVLSCPPTASPGSLCFPVSLGDSASGIPSHRTPHDRPSSSCFSSLTEAEPPVHLRGGVAHDSPPPGSVSLWLSHSWHRQAGPSASHQLKFGVLCQSEALGPPFCHLFPSSRPRSPPVHAPPAQPELAASRQPFIRGEEITAFNHGSCARRL